MLESYRTAKRRKVSHDATRHIHGQKATDTLREELLGQENQDSVSNDDDNDGGDDVDEGQEHNTSLKDLEEDSDTPNGDSEERGGGIHRRDAARRKSTLDVKPSRNDTLSSRHRIDGFEGSAFVGEVYKSNIFKLQVDELLAQVKPPTQSASAIEPVLRTLKGIIEQIPARAPQVLHEAAQKLALETKVKTPFPNPKPPHDANYKLEYAPPAHINITGSYPLNTGSRTGGNLVLDVVVTMPSALFQEKDYLNYRYFYKRAYYLTCLAAGIRDNKTFEFQLSFDYLHGNSLLPILIAEPSQDSLDHRGYRIVILPAIEDNIFPTAKLLPSRNCVRPKHNDTSAEPTKPQPTPFYNASLRVDSLVSSYLRLQHNATKTCDGYRDACILGRIWLQQRGFAGRMRLGGFGNFEWAVMIALLLQGGGPKDTPVFSSGYSSYQLFKATLQYLSSKDLTKVPAFIGGERVDLPKSNGMPVFFDISRSLNVLFKMTPWSYKLLQHEARVSVSALNDTVFDQFDSTFIMKLDSSLMKFDYLLNLPINVLVPTNEKQQASETLLHRSQQLFNALAKGLMDRVHLISIQLPEENNWDVDEESNPIDTSSVLSIGLVVDPVKANRTVDHGPSAEEQKEAAAFRRFWGDKAELRRFKDGSILECLVWEHKDGHRSVLEQVILYVLEKHIDQEVAQKARFIGNQHYLVLGQKTLGKQNGLAPFQTLMSAFQSLEGDIRGLDGLPLQIRQLQASSPQLSYSSVQAPLQAGYLLMDKPADVILQFEGSTRWPDDLKAIQRTKIAFLLKLADLLSTSVKELHARVGLENDGNSTLNQGFLDIVYNSGASFRLRIHHDREATLLERRMSLKTLNSAEKADASSALAAYKRVFLKEPAHTQAIQILCTRHAMLSPSIRLVKKWFSSHLLSPHFHPSLIELFAARTFTNPYPWAAPSSPTTALLRTLAFLARWDWRTEPWLVDVSAEGDALREADVAAMTTRFTAWRKIDPALNRVALFVASGADRDGTAWSDGARPPKVVATRLTALARAAVAEVKSAGPELDFATLFASGLGDYDFCVFLDRKVVGRNRAGQKKTAFKNLELQIDDEQVEAVGYDPVELFIRDLEDIYGDAMVLFYDEDGGDVIAGLWDPQTEMRAWKLKLGYSTIPVVAAQKGASEDGEKQVDVQINKAAILNEIARLGGDMVVKIDVKKS